MQKLLRCVAVGGSGCGLSASSAGAGELKLTIANGRVTLIAQDVPLRQILTNGRASARPRSSTARS